MSTQAAESTQSHQSRWPGSHSCTGRVWPVKGLFRVGRLEGAEKGVGRVFPQVGQPGKGDGV